MTTGNSLDLGINFLMHNDRTRIAFTIISALIFGVVSGFFTPRGPLTSIQTILTMIPAFVIGMVGGLLIPSKWISLLLFGTYWVALEITRINMSGPTVDGFHLNSFYGIITLVLGRGLHTVIVYTPMLLGVQYGSGPLTTGNYVIRERPMLIFLTIIVVILMGLLIRPGTTKPINEQNSIAEFTRVELGGKEQVLLIRGYDTKNPVLLYLAGGPGGTDLGAMRLFLDRLEKDFIVVTWEQRGAGKSYPALDPTETLTLEQAISDTIELSNYLRIRFNKNKIFIVANSRGTIPSVYSVKRSPELYYAYVGTGQMVDIAETDQMFYEDSLKYARDTGNSALESTLLSNGFPPYDDIRDYEALTSTEHDWNPYPGLDTDVEMPNILMVPEYSLLEKLHAIPATLDTYAVLYPQIQDIDFRKEASKIEVPIYMVIGQYEARGRAVLANEWFNMLEAPYKERIIFSNTGHRPLFENPEEFTELMNRIKDENS